MGLNKLKTKERIINDLENQNKKLRQENDRLKQLALIGDNSKTVEELIGQYRVAISEVNELRDKYNSSVHEINIMKKSYEEKIEKLFHRVKKDIKKN